MSRQNPFLAHPIPSVFWDLSFNDTTVLELQSDDAAFWATRIYERASPQPMKLSQPPAAETDTIRESGWSREIDISGATPAVLAELAFLDGLCLLVRRGDKAYVSKYAWLLYGPNGYFEMAVPQPFAQLMISYSLPGRYWWLRHGRDFLSTDTQTARALSAQMVEVEEEWNRLRTFVKPITEGPPSA